MNNKEEKQTIFNRIKQIDNELIALEKEAITYITIPHEIIDRLLVIASKLDELEEHLNLLDLNDALDG